MRIHLHRKFYGEYGDIPKRKTVKRFLWFPRIYACPPIEILWLEWVTDEYFLSRTQMRWEQVSTSFHGYKNPFPIQARIWFNWFRVILIYMGLLYSPSLLAVGKKPSECFPMVDEDTISWGLK